MDLLQNIDISHLSNFKTKAISKYFFEIKTFEDVVKLKDIYEFSLKNSLKIVILGFGTNTLFGFDFFDGIIIKNSLIGWSYNVDNKILETYTNESIWQISKDLEERYNQSIWHRFIGLPGSVGGAIFGNAGCFGLETESNFLDCEVFDLEKGIFINFDKNLCNFSYRNSFFKQNQKYFLVKARFDLSYFSEKYSSEVDNIKFREEVQPKGNSCGSFFKNPSKEFSAGKLLEEVGLKGFTYKNAYFSDKHSNFLMTKDDFGDYRNLLYLIDLARNKVKSKFGLELEPEVRILLN